MTDLRALVGACFLLAVMGIVVFVPLGWAIVLGIGEAYPEKIIKGRPFQRKDELVQKQILPRTTYEQIRYKIEASRSEIKRGGVDTTNPTKQASRGAAFIFS